MLVLVVDKVSGKTPSVDRKMWQRIANYASTFSGAFQKRYDIIVMVLNVPTTNQYSYIPPFGLLLGTYRRRSSV